MVARASGALLGLAVGDALGAAVEFKRPGTFESVTGDGQRALTNGRVVILAS